MKLFESFWGRNLRARFWREREEVGKREGGKGKTWVVEWME